jgi:tetratricopeptide (TPR) repeat protein
VVTVVSKENLMEQPVDIAGRDSFIFRAKQYLEGGFLDEAIALASERLSRYDDDVDAQIITATALVRQGKLTDALAILARLDERIEGWAQIYHLLGFVCTQQGNREAAVRAYEKLCALSSDMAVKQTVSEQIVALAQEMRHERRISPEVDVSLPPEPKAGADSCGDMGRRVEPREETSGEHNRKTQMSDPQEPIIDDENDEEEAYEAGSSAPSFYTLTLAQLYLQQGHYQMARDVLNHMLAKDIDNQAAREMLTQIETIKDNKWIPVIHTLTMWLRNLERAGVQ